MTDTKPLRVAVFGGATGTPVTDGTCNIVNAMQAAGVRRYIGLATPAVADQRDKPTVKGKVLRLMPRVAFPNALTEILGMTEAVTTSDLDWTIARMTSPNDKPAKGTVRSGFLGRGQRRLGHDPRRHRRLPRRPAQRQHLPARRARHQQLN